MILVLYSKSMPCLVLQVGPLYVYIYSPERLNNTSIIFHHTSLPLPFNIYHVLFVAINICNIDLKKIPPTAGESSIGCWFC
jgi:hypothetical protein